MKILPFFLPQFHPIEENDRWWGKGFSEWTNVAKSKPRFKGHRQPRIPADMGFYDLRLKDTRDAQKALAKKYLIDGFIYYHYWFSGKRLLNQPFDSDMSAGEIDIPIALCWANETWSRRWDGQEYDVLIKQDYSEDDDLNHALWLCAAFQNTNYLRINDKPLFIIYRPYDHPDINKFLELCDLECSKAGIASPFFLGVKNIFTDSELILKNPISRMDGWIDFQPNKTDFPHADTAVDYIASLASKILPDAIYQNIKGSVNAVRKINYENLVRKKVLELSRMAPNTFPCVFPSWDNSARRRSSVCIQNDDPKLFEDWSRAAIRHVNSNYSEDRQILFVNAWNEWAEGCYLEPDSELGHAFLTAIKNARN